MNDILTESITKVIAGSLNIRVWRQEENGDIETSQKQVKEIVLNYIMNNAIFSLYSVALSLIPLISRINAIEITNKDGAGVVLYINWP